MTRVSANASISAISLAHGRHRHHREVAEHRAIRRVLHDHAGGAAAPQDVSRRQVRGVAERALALDHDHVRVLTLERSDDLVLDLARTELGDQRIQRDARTSRPGSRWSDRCRP